MDQLVVSWISWLFCAVLYFSILFLALLAYCHNTIESKWYIRLFRLSQTCYCRFQPSRMWHSVEWYL